MKTFHQVKYSWGYGGVVSPPAGPGQSPGGDPVGKAPEALKSLHSTLPEVVKKSNLAGNFFYVLHLKVTEKIIKFRAKSKHSQTNVGRLRSFTKVIEYY